MSEFCDCLLHLSIYRGYNLVPLKGFSPLIFQVVPPHSSQYTINAAFADASVHFDAKHVLIISSRGKKDLQLSWV